MQGRDALQVGKTQPEFTKSFLTITNKKTHILVLTEVSSCSNGLILPGFRKEIKRP